jgi:hypothetical protein
MSTPSPIQGFVLTTKNCRTTSCPKCEFVVTLMSLCGMYLCLAYETWFVSVFYSSVLFRLCMVECIVQTLIGWLMLEKLSSGLWFSTVVFVMSVICYLLSWCFVSVMIFQSCFCYDFPDMFLLCLRQTNIHGSYITRLRNYSDIHDSYIIHHTY